MRHRGRLIGGVLAREFALGERRAFLLSFAGLLRLCNAWSLKRCLFAGDPEVRERGVRMVFEHRGEFDSQFAAIKWIAPKVGCGPDTLRGWVRRAETDSGRRDCVTTAERDRIKALERENRQLRQANEILKKSSAYFAPLSADCFAIACRAMMKREKFDIAGCTVERLMRDIGIKGVRRGKKIKTTWPDKALPSPPDHVNRQFRARMPNQLWVSDFTYVSTWQGFVYVALVIDIFANKLVGWRASRSQQTQFVLDALEQALYERRPADNLIYHSNRS